MMMMSMDRVNIEDPVEPVNILTAHSLRTIDSLPWKWKAWIDCIRSLDSGTTTYV